MLFLDAGVTGGRFYFFRRGLAYDILCKRLILAVKYRTR